MEQKTRTRIEKTFSSLREIYGITMEMYPERVPGQRAPATAGPLGPGCDPSTRTLFVDPWELSRGVSESNRPEAFLHEIVHIIVQPPFWTIDQAPEDFILMQFERCLARCYFKDGVRKRIKDWQAITVCTASDCSLQDVEDVTGTPYWNTIWWRAGYGFCERLGLIDGNRKPTGKYPDWSVLEPVQEEIKKFYEGVESVSLETLLKR